MDIDVKEQNIYDISPDLLQILLSDKTTKNNIRWGSNNYTSYGQEYRIDQEIKSKLITGRYSTVIQPRVAKRDEQKIARTRDKAEVFTPSWICNAQNNLVDEAWFGRKDVFNREGNKEWITNRAPIVFPKDKTWKEYIDARRLEVSCGEAPYLVSRYDTVSGRIIPIDDRIGILDRKIRVINENVESNQEWMKWTIRACQSCYGYEFQGDNVLLARENLLYTFIDYYIQRFDSDPSLKELKKIANIIAWNIWQMNGITMTTPYSLAKKVNEQLSMDELIWDIEDEEETINPNEMLSKIYDWRSNKSIEYKSLLKGR